MASLAARPRVPSDRTASAAPVVPSGSVHATPHAEAAHVNAATVASAVKQIAPQRMRRSSTIDAVNATAVASSELAVDGPPGTARNAATAANMTAMTLSVTQSIGIMAGASHGERSDRSGAGNGKSGDDVAGRRGHHARPQQRRRAEHGRA